jgi:hypothetical protein
MRNTNRPTLALQSMTLSLAQAQAHVQYGRNGSGCLTKRGTLAPHVNPHLARMIWARLDRLDRQHTASELCMRSGFFKALCICPWSRKGSRLDRALSFQGWPALCVLCMYIFACTNPLARGPTGAVGSQGHLRQILARDRISGAPAPRAGPGLNRSYIHDSAPHALSTVHEHLVNVHRYLSSHSHARTHTSARTCTQQYARTHVRARTNTQAAHARARAHSGAHRVRERE